MRQMKTAIFALAIPLMTQAANFSAHKAVVNGVEVVQLSDTARQMEVSVVPSIGNIAYEFKVAGKNVLYFPTKDLSQFAQRPGLAGIPFLAPWANRLDFDGFWANDKKYN